jgi:hypothetical protein
MTLSVGIIIPNIWKNKKCSKASTSDVFIFHSVYTKFSPWFEGCFAVCNTMVSCGYMPSK